MFRCGGAPQALASLLRVAIMHRLTDQYGPIPYSKVIENRQNSLAVAGGVIESNSDNAQFKPAVNRTVICFSEWKQHLISADLDSYMNGYADPRRAGMGCLALRFSGRVSAAAATLEPRVAAPCQTCQNSCPEPLTFMVELSGPSRVPSPRFRSRVVVPSGLWTKGGLVGCTLLCAVDRVRGAAAR